MITYPGLHVKVASQQQGAEAVPEGDSRKHADCDAALFVTQARRHPRRAGDEDVSICVRFEAVGSPLITSNWLLMHNFRLQVPGLRHLCTHVLARWLSFCQHTGEALEVPLACPWQLLWPSRLHESTADNMGLS